MAYTNTKTPIVYYGGKTAIWNHIAPLIPVVHEVYTEVFLGGGTVYWSKEPAKNETINDTLDIVINFYQQLKLNYAELNKLIQASLVSRSIHKKAISIIRAHAVEPEPDKCTLAWAFWICTNFAYSNKIGGGYKYSNDMSVCVPDTMTRRKKDFTEVLAARLEHTYIENEDALKILGSRNVPAAFHYIDPPYCGADMGHYDGYTWEQYETLLTWCAHDCKGKFLLSNYDSELLQKFICENNWRVKYITHRLKAPRSSGAISKTEVLIWNYNTDESNNLFTNTGISHTL